MLDIVYVVVAVTAMALAAGHPPVWRLTLVVWLCRVEVLVAALSMVVFALDGDVAWAAVWLVIAAVSVAGAGAASRRRDLIAAHPSAFARHNQKGRTGRA